MGNKLTHELQALLPEIFRLRIWEEKGFQSIYHYASVLAGLSSGVVDKVLRVEKSLEDKPHLKEIIKTEGVHKVAIIAKITTSENEQEMAKIVRNCIKRAVQQYSKEIRGKKENLKIELDDEMQQMFFEQRSFEEDFRRTFRARRNFSKIPGEKIDPPEAGQAKTKKYILIKYDKGRATLAARSKGSYNSHRCFVAEISGGVRRAQIQSSCSSLFLAYGTFLLYNIPKYFKQKSK